MRRSPINSHMDESLAGATSIRAFNAQDRFIWKKGQLVDESQAANFLSLAVLRYVSRFSPDLLMKCGLISLNNSTFSLILFLQMAWLYNELYW